HTTQPRLGFSYLVTRDARNVLRGSYVRVGEQMMGRDAVTTFGGNARVGMRDDYGVNLDQKIDSTIRTPANTAAVAANPVPPAPHHPSLARFILRFRQQLPYSFGHHGARVPPV